ncbi:FAD-dependent monooxygenase paxM [Lasiodiplodia theobromae]|uniref:FAD-dependent monooxygenase paxM n=1 Tax=Lasiodiplodia theobromae TaxID=45133 RepID=A0A5N5D6G4_9PEZI|nr:FAD-dependent monooxygenase paxM [Lasiodiplodia theobromae]
MASLEQIEKTQVIIVGGGISGLSLALMLEQLGVSYLLLEAYSSLTKPVGALIALNPNGLRILDQLGVLPDINAVATPLLRHVVIDGESGKRIADLSFPGYMRERHGYETAFQARHEVVVALERNMKSKERLRVGKRVVSVNQDEKGAMVHCEDGSRYRAQMVVGADGVHSVVRREVLKMAKEKDATLEGADIVRCEYGTVFAIANPSEHLQPGDGYSFQRNSCNGGVVCGRDGRNYLFYHFRRPGPYDVPVEKLPRMSATEVEERWAEILPRRVSESADFTYADLLSAGTTSKGQSVLPHFTLPKWYNGRIMAMGDAVHKFNPMTAQGGNNCIETAAAIANHLHDTLARHNIPLLQPQWPKKAVEEIFAAVEQERMPRVTGLVQESQELQYTFSWDTWWYKIVAKYLFPRMNKSKIADASSNSIVGAVTLKGDRWEVPHPRDHIVPWEDEAFGKDLSVLGVLFKQ